MEENTPHRQRIRQLPESLQQNPPRQAEDENSATPAAEPEPAVPATTTTPGGMTMEEKLAAALVQAEQAGDAVDVPERESDTEKTFIRVMPDGSRKRIIRRRVAAPSSTPASSATVKRVLVGFLAVLFLGVFTFYGLMLWGLMSNSLDNALFKTLGLDGVGLKNALVLMTNIIFGLIALWLLILTLIKFFQYFSNTKASPQIRRGRLGRGVLYLLLFLLMGGLWIALFMVINRQQVAAREQVSEAMIITDPVDVRNLSAPVLVRFDIGTKLYQQLPQNAVNSIEWDFDSDGITDARGDTVTYRFLNLGENGGVYNVKATVTYRENPGDPLSPVRTYEAPRQVIIANESVAADIIASPESGVGPLSVELSAAKSTDPDGDIVYYEWDLNNDGTYEEQGIDLVNVVKTYTQLGSYIVNLRVTGRNGDFATAQKTIEVLPPDENLRPEIGALTPLEGEAPLSVVLDGSASFARVGRIVKYEWFVEGDAESFVGRKYEKTFRRAGEYEVKLVIEDDTGVKAEAVKTVKVLPRVQDIELRIDTTPDHGGAEFLTGEAPLEVVFNATNSQIDNPIEFQWDFENDGIVDKFSPVVKHTYYTPGIYEVQLQVIDSDENVYEKVQKVQVNGASIRAAISALPSNGEVPLRVEFDASGSRAEEGDTIVNYIWSLPGQSPISYGAQISYEFTDVGMYEIGLKIVTAAGKTKDTVTRITVRPRAVRARMTAEPAAGAAPLTVQFSPTGSEGTIYGYTWDFGDGNLSTDTRPKHTYTQPGTYTATLKVTDRNGLISETSAQVVVR
ncbi:PKD domain-containing protein [Candidatus Peribacteria bacterium]|nr:PKD domain-containing protein [Candidatus Peribacteria bacterium]